MADITALFQKFIQNKCTKEEIVHVIHLIEQRPELWNEFLSDTEWQQFPNAGIVDPALTKQIWDNITLETGVVCHRRRVNLRAVAMAAVFFITGFSVWMFIANTGTKGKRQVAKHLTVPVADTLIANTSAGPQQIILEDQSTVLLSPNSSLRFPLHFPGNGRPIHLLGEAVFEVAKDKRRPFTVYSGNLSTTAVGTKFRVDCTADDKVRVQLMQGRVVIKPVGNDARSFQSVFLTPGKELVFDKIHYRIQVHRFYTENRYKVIKSNATSNHSDPLMSFTNESLEVVFKKLERAYHKHLTFHRQEVEDLYFTGDFKRSDSLKNILSLIASLNGLKIQLLEDGYTISRQQ